MDKNLKKLIEAFDGGRFGANYCLDMVNKLIVVTQQSNGYPVMSLEQQNNLSREGYRCYNTDGEELSLFRFGKIVYNPVTANITEEIVEDLYDRRRKGLEEYGVTVDDADLSKQEWLQHLYEELLDACIYIKKYLKDEKV